VEEEKTTGEGELLEQGKTGEETGKPTAVEGEPTAVKPSLQSVELQKRGKNGIMPSPYRQSYEDAYGRAYRKTYRGAYREPTGGPTGPAGGPEYQWVCKEHGVVEPVVGAGGRGFCPKCRKLLAKEPLEKPPEPGVEGLRMSSPCALPSNGRMYPSCPLTVHT